MKRTDGAAQDERLDHKRYDQAGSRHREHYYDSFAALYVLCSLVVVLLSLVCVRALTRRRKKRFLLFFAVKVTLAEVMSKKEHYGCSTIGAGKTVVVEFSSPNIAKIFHAGKVFFVVCSLGASLFNIPFNIDKVICDRRFLAIFFKRSTVRRATMSSATTISATGASSYAKKII